MKPKKEILPALLAALGLTLGVMQAQTTFTWTGGTEATPWYDTGNWDVNGVPNQTDGGGSGTTLGTEEENALVVFDSETAMNNYMPTETINVSTDWFGGGTSDHLIPSLQVLNGTLNLGSSNAQWWHYAGGTVYQIGDGDLTTAAQINTGFGNWTRHFDRGGGFLMTINADGTLNQTGNFQLTNSPVTITLNGGVFVSSGTVAGLAGNGSRVINFDAAGSSFTAQFGNGTSTDFVDLAAVSAEIGSSFVDNTGAGLVANDNGDGTFTVGFAAAALITSFEGAGATGVIDQSGMTIALEVPAGTDLATLAPTFTLSSGSCDQTSGAAPSPTFAVQNPVDYVVTDGGTVNTYTVTVTVDVPDLTPPAISSLSPVNGATDVPKGDNLELTFDEDIAVASGFITLKNLTAATQVQIDVTDGSQVSVAGPVLTINPTSDLVLGNEYAVQIDANAIEDLASPANGFGGISDDTTWRFTVFLGNYVWTGGKEATPWYDTDNWGSGGAPTQGSSLGTPESDAIVVFNSETAVNGYMPTDTLTVDSDWNSSEHLMPGVQVLNGTLNLAGPGGNWWHYAGGNVLQIGDGDLTTMAQVNTSFTNWVRHLDKGGKNLITVNADGVMNQSANFQWGQNGDTEMTLNGGTFTSSGTVQGLATRAGSFINFDADGSTFTALFGDGVTTDFVDLAAVTAEIGSSFVNNTSGVLLAQDNGDGSFTVGFLAASITSFEGAGSTGVINQAAKTIALEVPFGTDLATLAPTFALSSGSCDQTSGAAPSPTFAAQNPATYTVTDTSTDPDTINVYTVTVTIAPEQATIVIDLGAGTEIKGGDFIATGPANLPLPSLPLGSILKSIDVNATLSATDNDNFASDLALLFDPTPGAPGGDFSVGICRWLASAELTVGTQVEWDAATGEGGAGTALVDSLVEADWIAGGSIDLGSTGLFLGNNFDLNDGEALQGGTWSGTITLTYEVGAGGTDYDTWAAGFPGADLTDPNADLDGDGLTNDGERAFGLDPTDPSSADPFTVPVDAAGTFSYSRRDPALSGLSFSIWTSTDLENWSEDTGAGQTPGAVVSEVQEVAVTTSTAPVGGKLFVQVRAD